MINYIIQVVLFQALFLAVYDLFLQKETFFKWNRAYLLATPVLAFLIPFLKFESFQNTVSQEYITQLPTVFLNPEAFIVESTSSESTYNVLPLLFFAGIILFSTLFIVRLFKIINLIIHNKIINQGSFKLVILSEQKSAFSFFNYIFIHKKLLDNKKLDIIKHETIHCKQLHTIDLLFFEVLKILMWFNPLVYVYQKRITLLHEYISDAEVVKESDKKSYFNTLLAETFNVEDILFVNQFYKHSLIKKRIVMITKNKSQKMKQLKYLLLIPLLTGMLLYTSCSSDTQAEIEQVENALKEENIPSEGRYFRAENGFTIFTGTHLAGKVVPEEEYTKKEQEIITKFSEKGESLVKMSIIIDENGDRVYFLKTKYAPKETVEIEKVDDGSIPFAVIDEVPVYPGCEGTKEELRLCLQEKITQHVSQNFNSDLANQLGLEPGTKRIFVMFKIDKEGNVTDIQARAPHKDLQSEAIRVVETLPQMTPGKQDGKAVSVKYSLPIAFKVAGDATTSPETSTEGLPDNVLYVVDGKEITKGALKKITPDQIASMNVLKGENAIKKYGEKGENGVIEITLKEE